MDKNDRMRKLDLLLTIFFQTSLHSVSFIACIKGIVESDILLVEVLCTAGVIVIVTIYIFLISLLISDYIEDKNKNTEV